MSKSTQYYYAVGRRKEATAVVKLFSQGSGKYTVRTANGSELSLKEFFGGNKYMYDTATHPFAVLGGEYGKMFDAEIVIRGGGRAGQADAIKLGISRALIEFDSDLRLSLKPHGLLKRDSRIKERKKPGLKKARKGPTWSKR